MMFECCDRQALAKMDHKWPLFGEDSKLMVNTMCMRCYTHWAGLDGNVKIYTKKQWEDHINEQYMAIP